MIKLPSGQGCAACGQQCDLAMNRVLLGEDPEGQVYGWVVHESGRPTYNQENLSFCGPACSLIHHEEQAGRAIPEWLDKLKGTRVAA